MQSTQAAGPGVAPADVAQVVARWAGAALASPVEVRYRRRFGCLFAFLMLFFGGMPVLVIATNGLRGAGGLVAGMCVAMAAFLYFILNRANQKAARRFDASGVLRGDGRRFPWTDFTGVNYRMALEPGGADEGLWRVELTFATGLVWIIPHRVENLAEISALVTSIPGPQRKSRA